MNIDYTYQCGYTGLQFRCTISGAHSVSDESYPPGGFLRIVRNKEGQIIAGPLVSELLSWKERA